MKTTLRNTFLFTALLVMVFSVTSCYKKKDTIAKVYVLDANNAPVGGTEVRLFYGVNADSARIDELGTTDASGLATFNFNELYKSGQAGFVVGIIKVEEETTSEETVII